MSAGVCQRTACGSLFFLSPMWVWGSNSGWKTWWQTFLPTKPSKKLLIENAFIGRQEDELTFYFYFYFIILFNFVCFGCSISVQLICAWCPWRLELDIRYPGTEVWVWAAMWVQIVWTRSRVRLSALKSPSGALPPARQDLLKVL